MSAMADREQSRRLDGEVQIDDAYLGGERTGGPGEPQWRNKVPFIAAVSLHQGRPRYLRLDVVSSFRRSVVHTWAQQALAPGTHVVSDGLTAFTGVGWAGLTHDAIVTGSGRKGALSAQYLRCQPVGTGYQAPGADYRRSGRLRSVERGGLIVVWAVACPALRSA
jgi:hypothetical protein